MEKKILITYFSVFPKQDKFTEKLAKKIYDKTGGKMIEIECEKKYPQKPEEYPLIEKIVHEEIEKGICPGIRNIIPIEDYDIIFVGYPIWHYTLPQVMLTFFRKYDFSNKIIVPFNTHEGSYDSGTWEKIKQLAQEAIVLDGLAVRGFEVDKMSDQIIENWLRKLNILQ